MRRQQGYTSRARPTSMFPFSAVRSSDICTTVIFRCSTSYCGVQFVCFALCHHIMCPLPFKVNVAGEGGLRALVALSRCEDLELRILAAGALRHLSLNTRVKRPMVEEGALGSILR